MRGCWNNTASWQRLRAIEREADKAIHNRSPRPYGRHRSERTGACYRPSPDPDQRSQAVRANDGRAPYPRRAPSAVHQRRCAAGQAEKASKAGNLDVAGAEKRSQLVNIYAAKAAYARRKKLRRACVT